MSPCALSPILIWTLFSRRWRNATGPGSAESRQSQENMRIFPARQYYVGVIHDMAGIKRQALLKANLQRLDGPEIEIHSTTLQEFAGQPQGGFAGVLVDAPCSGLGVIRRQPDIRWQRSLAALQGYQDRQRELLSAAAGLVEKKGVLVYATCSIDPMENDEVIGAFLREHPEFSTTLAQESLPEAARGLCDGAGFLKTTPEQGLDGFFAARMVRKG